MATFGVREISYHLTVRASQNWFSAIILTSLKMYAYRDKLGAFEGRYVIAPTHVRLTKKKNVFS